MGAKLRRTIIVLMLVLLVVAVALTIVVNRYRDSIALEVANRVLADSEVRVTDVSVDSISAEAVHFTSIVAQLENGDILEIAGVSLPVSFRSLRELRLHADSVSLVPAGVSAGEPAFAAGLAAYLEAGSRLHGAAIEVDEIRLPGAPPISDFAWYADTLNPTLRLAVEGIDITLTVTPAGGRDFRASLRALTEDSDEIALLAFRILPFGEGFMLEGDARFRFDSLLPLLRFYGALPAEVSALSGAMVGFFEVRIDAEAGAPVLLSARLDMSAPVTTGIRTADGTTGEVVVTSASRISATLQYPAMEWTAGSNAVQLAISGAGLDAQVVDLEALRCESGIDCQGDVSLTFAAIGIGGLSVDSATLSAQAVDVHSRDGRWRAASDSAGLVLEAPAYTGQRFVAPLIDGRFEASDEQLSTRLRITTAEGGLTGSAEIDHDLASGSGGIRFDDLLLDINILHFSEIFERWPYDWDVTGGTWRIDGAIAWEQSGSGFAYRGQSAHTVDSLAGTWGDIGFAGLSTRAELSLESDKPPDVAPGSFEVALVDIGFPIEDISGRYVLDIDDLAVDLDAVEMSALGGVVRVAPFRFDLDADSNELLLGIDSVQLPLMVALANLDSVDISGSVSGDIPISIRGGSIVVEDGFLEADPPGGAIRYLGGDAGGITDDQAQLSVVTRTLRNLRYEALTSEVHYTEQGDLKLQMRLTGTNPDVDPDQPVILNLGIENNVPQMLRSLQATRSIEEVLERKLSK